MKANELRIGNNIHDPIGNVISVTKVTLSLLTIAPTAQEQFQPIPLTKEWLVKFGFEYEANPILGYSKGNLILVKYNDGWGDFSDSNSIQSFKHIQYVHQLQNLFFALTGEELSI